MRIKQGDIITFDLTGVGSGSVQSGVRMCVVVSNDLCNKHSSVITAVPLTGRVKKDLKTHFPLDHKKYYLDKPSIALAEQIMSIDKERAIKKKPRPLCKEDLKQLLVSVKVQLGIC